MVHDTVLKFIQAINDQNVSLIIQMMSEDFAFVDTYGDVETKEEMKSGWREYFNLFPDYAI